MLFNVNPDNGDKVFLIVMAPDLTKFVARFISILLMHWCVKNDVEQGLKTMQFVVKHPSQFMNPNLAFCVGFGQFSGGFLTEILCLINLCSDMSVVFIIMSGATFMCVSLIDNFYAASLPPDNIMSGQHTQYEKKKEQVYMHSEEEAQHIQDSKIWEPVPNRPNLKQTEVQRITFKGGGNYVLDRTTYRRNIYLAKNSNP
jgi:hypothetical protein